MIFEEAAYEQAKDTFLKSLAYMHQANEKYAELRGGLEQLNEADRRRYDLNRMRIIDLVAYHDAAEAYVARLGAYVEDLVNAHRQLAAEQREERDGWRRHFPRLEGESPREHARHLSITRAQMEQPHLY